MKMKKTKKYFGDKDFGKLVSGGLSGISALNSGKFNKIYDFEDDIDLENQPIKDNLKIEQIKIVRHGKENELEIKKIFNKLQAR